MKAPVLLLFLTPAFGQSLHFAGGSSTLLNAAGGGGTVYLPNNEIYIGGGRGVSFSDKLNYRGFDLIAGDSSFNYGVDGAGISIFNRGVKVERKSDKETIGAFAGLTGFSYQVPFFSSMYEARHPGIGFYYKRKVSKWRFQSLDLFSRQKTAIQSAAYDGSKISFSLNGGIVENLFQSGANFTFHPDRTFSASAAHISQKNFDSDSAFINWQRNWFQAHASFIRDTFAGKQSSGEAFGAGGHWKWFQARSDFYRSGAHNQIVNTLTETSAHWMLTEAINNANQFQFGGGYHSNRVSLSFNHSIAFLPGRGFQQVIQVGIQFKVHDTGLNAVAYKLDRFRYTAYGDQWLQGPVQVENGHRMHKGIGKYAQTGKVIRPNGLPVEGAAVLVGTQIVYTDQNGSWTYRSKRKDALPVRIALDQFLCPGTWTLIKQDQDYIIIETIKAPLPD